MTTVNNEQGSRRFFLVQILRGIGLLAIFIVVFILFKSYEGEQYFEWLEPVYSNPALVFAIFTLSEVFFGIITPEIFMAWGLNQGGPGTYMLIITGLMLISYGAGWLNYFIGLKSRQISWIRWFISRRLRKYSRLLEKYGDDLIIIAAVTPLPFGAVCLLVGSVEYSQR